MKKLMLLVLIFILTAQLSFAQKKIIILDFYTDWCIPCKQMEKHIFGQKRVQDVLKTNFELRRVNAEDGDGVALARRYNISGYPTLLFTDVDGVEINRLQGVPLNVNFFLEMLSIVNGKTVDIPALYQAFNNADGEKKLDIAQQLALQGPPCYMLSRTENQRALMSNVKTAVDYYFANKPVESMVNGKDFEIISMFLDGATNERAQITYLYKNYKEFKEVVSERDLAEFVVKVNNQSIQDYSRKGDLIWKRYVGYIGDELADAYAFMGEKGAKELMNCVANINTAVYVDKNFDRYITLRDKYTALLNENGNDTNGNYLYAAQVLYSHSGGKLTQKQSLKGIQWLEKNIEEGFNLPATFMLMGDLYALIPDKVAESIYNYNRCAMEAKKQGTRVEARYINLVKSRIAKLKSAE